MSHRRATVVVPRVLAVGAAAVFALPAAGQDRTEERLTDLETRVAALETTVVMSAPPATELEGSGNDVTAAFNLEAGRYRVDATYTAPTDLDSFYVNLHGPFGMDQIFIETIPEAGEWEGSTIVRITYAGEHYIEVLGAEGDWTLTFTPLP